MYLSFVERSLHKPCLVLVEGLQVPETELIRSLNKVEHPYSTAEHEVNIMHSSSGQLRAMEEYSMVRGTSLIY